MIQLTKFGCILIVFAAAHATASISPHDRAAYRHFATVLLIQKNPQTAYAAMAAPDLIQHNPPFGTGIATTIRQWQTMTSLPQSRFTLQSIRFNGDMAVLQFQGILHPGQPGAEVVQRDRLRNGKIIEEWGEFKILPAQ